MILSVVALSTAFAGSAGAASSQFDDLYWQGQEQLVTDLEPGANYQIRSVELNGTDIESTSLVQERTADEDGTIKVSTSGLDPGDYLLRGPDVNPTDSSETWEVAVQQFTVEFDDNDVTEGGSPTFGIDSNRGSFNINVSADQLDYDDLDSIFANEDEEPRFDETRDEHKDDDVIVLNADGDKTLEADFTDITPGGYTFEFEVTDADAAVSTTVPANKEGAPPVYDFQLDNDGEAYTLGFPAPVEGTLADALDQNDQDIGSETTAYVFEDGTWVNNDIDEITLDALDAVVIVTDGENGDDTIELQVEFETTETPTPGDVTVTEGWNFVSAPAYEGANTVFDVGSSREVFNPFASADSPAVDPTDDFLSYRIGADEEPTVSPFHGYFVYVEEEDHIQSGLAGGVVDLEQSDEYLNVD